MAGQLEFLSSQLRWHRILVPLVLSFLCFFGVGSPPASLLLLRGLPFWSPRPSFLPSLPAFSWFFASCRDVLFSSGFAVSQSIVLARGGPLGMPLLRLGRLLGRCTPIFSAPLRPLLGHFLPLLFFGVSCIAGLPKRIWRYVSASAGDSGFLVFFLGVALSLRFSMFFAFVALLR